MNIINWFIDKYVNWKRKRMIKKKIKKLQEQDPFTYHH